MRLDRTPGGSISMNRKMFTVDAFTAEAFRGNPAGVCMLHDQATDSWMQAVAAEMRFSETAFLLHGVDGSSIRYFTPVTEIPLCGHATIASAHVLWEEKLVLDQAEITFFSKSGTLHAHQEDGWVCLDFPSMPVKRREAAQGLAEALGAELVWVSGGVMGGYLIELGRETEVRNLNPDFVALRRGNFGAIIVTARSDSAGCDFVSRFFWPEGGIDEDPVTGVAHCSLGPYWAGRLGKDDLVGQQVSQRGGIVRVRVRGERVDILGQAVTIVRGEILV